MSKSYAAQTAFTQGYLSPYLRGRTDLQQYYNGVARLKNYVVMKQGGVKPFPGSKFVLTAAASSSRLIPFITSDTNAYMLELSNLSMRIYTAGASLVTITTPYTTAQIPDIEYIQVGGSMVLVHTGVTPKLLKRISNTQWTLQDYPFSIAPNSEKGVTLSANNLTLSALSGAITATAASAVFAVTDVGRQITAGTGLLTITGYTSATVVTGTSLLTFDSLVNTSWTLTDSPQTGLTPSSANIGDTSTLTLDAAGWRGGAGLAGYTDVGSYISINGGLIRVNSITSSTVASGTVVKALTGVTKAFAGSWTDNSADFSATLGYPGAATFFEGRLILGGSSGFPNRLWFSASGATDNFALGVNDGDAFSYDIGDAFDQIMHLIPAKALLCLTYSGEYTISSRSQGPITPTATTIRRQTSWGCNRVKPVLVDNVLMFVQRSGKKIFAMQYDYTIDGYQSHELTEFIPDLFDNADAQIKSLVFSAEPIPTLYMISSYSQDNVAGDYLKTCTLEFSQNIRAWAFQDIGQVTSLAIIPYSLTNQVWINKNGTIETLDQALDLWSTRTYAGPIPAGLSVFGLDHLNGLPVTILADGVPISGLSTSFGSLVVPVAVVTTLIVGLFYTSECTLLPIEDQVNGSATGKRRRLSEWFIRLYNTQCLTVNGSDQAFRRMDTNVLDLPPPLFTGIKKDIALGWTEQGAEISFSRTVPLKQVVLGINRGFDAND